MTPVRPVETSSASLPRQRRPLGLRRPSFAQMLEDEPVTGPEKGGKGVPSTPFTVIDADIPLESTDAAAAMAARAFQHAEAAGRLRHSGKIIDVII